MEWVFVAILSVAVAWLGLACGGQSRRLREQSGRIAALQRQLEDLRRLTSANSAAIERMAARKRPAQPTGLMSMVETAIRSGPKSLWPGILVLGAQALAAYLGKKGKPVLPLKKSTEETNG